MPRAPEGLGAKPQTLPSVKAGLGHVEKEQRKSRAFVVHSLVEWKEALEPQGTCACGFS